MKIKRIVPIVIALIMAFSCAACHNKPAEGGPPPQGEKSVTINGSKTVELYFGESATFTATTKGGTVLWEIDGEAYGSTITDTGTFTAGNTEGQVTVKAYLEGDTAISDTLTVIISKKSVTVNGSKTVELYFGESATFTATAKGGTVLWEIDGEAYGSTITDTGTFTAGNTEGQVPVKAYLEGNATISDTLTVTIVEPMEASASALGTSHNNIIQLNNFRYTFRTYFKVRESGAFEYSFYYDNKLDTTWWNVSNATANRNGSAFKIEEAYFADGGEYADGSVETSTSVPILFEGALSKDVAEGEEFSSDAVRFNVPEGHFLAFTWTIAVDVSVGPSVPFTESVFAACFKKDGKYSSQEDGTGFAMADSTFESQVLVAPNKIMYKRPKGRNLVFVGDSITQGVSTRRDLYEFWVARVADELPASHSVWNLGSGWATAGNLASDGAWLKKAATADELFICVGVNDLGGNITLAEYQELVRSIVADVKEKNADCVVTLFTVPPFNYSGTQGDTWHAMNAWIRGGEVEGVDRYFDFAAVLSQSFPRENYLQTHYMSSVSDTHPNGLAGAAVAEAFLNWYESDDDTIAEAYDNYLNVDINEAVQLPAKVLVKTVGGWYDYRSVEWNSAVSTAAAGITEYTGSFASSTVTVKYTVRVRSAVAENTVYYEVTCGNMLASGGGALLNSTNDRIFGEDAATGKQWGCHDDAPYGTNIFWENGNKWWAIRCSKNDGTNDRIKYGFELEAGTYTLALGFQDPWAVTRIMELYIDDVLITDALDNGSGAQTAKYFTFTVASKKVVDVCLYETTGTGASVNWISITECGTPSDNDIVYAFGGHGFAELQWNASGGATEYEISYGTASGAYTSQIATDRLSARIGNLVNGTAYFFAVRGKNAAGYSQYSNEVKVVPSPCVDTNIMYYVDCGTVGLVRLGNRLGICQSVEDQAYGEDAATGYSWGYTLDGSPWNSGSPMPENSVLVAGLEDSKKVGYGIHYAFELEDGNYTVEVTFFDEWSHPARILALKVGGEKVAEGCFGLLRPETVQKQTTVVGGQLTVDIVGGTGNHDDAMVAAIVIRKAS